MAFTVDKLTDFPLGAYQAAQPMMPVKECSFEIDFSATGNSLAQNQIMRITQIPAGTAILSAMVQVITANTSVTDIDIGFGTATTTVATIFDGISLATAGWLAANNLTVTNGASYMTATNNISITNKDADTLSSGKIKVVLLIADFAAAVK
jgi:hypothetical protein